MPLITSISEEIVALDLGRIVAQGPPQEVVNNPIVVASYLGTSQEVIQRSGEIRAKSDSTAESLAALVEETEKEAVAASEFAPPP